MQESFQSSTGEVLWFNDDKGYGFLKVEGVDGDVFVHYAAIRMQGFRHLRQGQRVRCQVHRTEKGWQAQEVEVQTDATPDDKIRERPERPDSATMRVANSERKEKPRE